MAGKKNNNTKPASQKEKRKAKHAENALRFYVPAVLGASALLLMLLAAHFWLPDMGLLGNPVRDFFFGLFGCGMYVLPFYLIFLAFIFNRTLKGGWIVSRTVLIVCDFLLLTMLIPLLLSQDKFASYDVGALWNDGVSHIGGGVIGGGLALLLSRLISAVASLIIVLIAFVTVTVYMFGSSLDVAFFRSKSMVQKAGKAISESNRVRRQRIESEMKAQEQLDEENERKNSIDTLPERIEKKKKQEKRIDDNLYDMDEEEKHIDDGEDVREDSDIVLPVIESMGAEEEPKKKTKASLVTETHRDAVPPRDETVTPTVENGEIKFEPDFDDPQRQYIFPPTSLLAAGDGGGYVPSEEDIKRNSAKIEEIMRSFNIGVKVTGVSCGPTVTRYEVQPEAGVRVKAVLGLQEDLQLHLSATSVRMENIPGRAAVGIEIPNVNKSIVPLRDLIENDAFKNNKSKLNVALGVDISGKPVYMDIQEKLHVLVAGATGMGKSVCINSIIVSLLYRARPDEVKLILIDPKFVEFKQYDGLPHLLVPVINDAKKAAGTLKWACTEMDRRYQLLQEVGVSNLQEYNRVTADDPERDYIPSIVIIIDEFADLMMTASGDVENSVCRIAQKARAAGIYLIMGTQRPSVDVITGLIKANIPTRIAFRVASQVDSRTILDIAGAEKLMGKGDMLYYPTGVQKPTRLQGSFVSVSREVNAVCEFIRAAAEADYDSAVIDAIENEAKLCGVRGKKQDDGDMGDSADGIDKDEGMIIQALELAMNGGMLSTTMLQSQLSLGYARAARVMSKLEKRGYIGAMDPTTKKRNVLITQEEFLQLKLNYSGEDKA